MSFTDDVEQDLHCKIVYYGPALCGKTANLTFIHGKAPAATRGELLKLPTDTERTLFFDYLPLSFGKIGGRNVRFHIYSVPGQRSYESTRASLLDKVDGIVFVVDSGRSKFQDNVNSYSEMRRILSSLGRELSSVPLVIQFNKRDVPDAVPTPILDARLNGTNAPNAIAIASRGVGVIPTLRAISRLVLAKYE
jgi:signal recognition particle receptor subunit beta